jgi:beta-lactamase superfamily II metal-dependent hydrolase
MGCWQVVFPGSVNNVAKADDEPLVLIGNFCGTKMLLLSDLSRTGQDELLARTNDLAADIVVAGLPAEGEPLCNTLLEVVHPKLIVIADSEFPATRRAGRSLRERLEQKQIPVIYTRTAGAVTVHANQHGWQVETMDGQRFSSAPSSK